MGYSTEDLETILRKLRYELTACQTKVSEALTALGELSSQFPKPPTDEPVCPVCGLERHNEDALRDHLANVHGKRVAV